MTGDVPTKKQTLEVVEEFKKRRRLPQYVIDILRAMPTDTHPMTMFSAGILAMQRESVFVKRYNEGMKKMDYWEPMFEDVLNLLPKLPVLAAYIYRMKYKADIHIAELTRTSTWAATSPTRWASPRPTTTSPGCTSSSTPTTSRATSRPTPPTWWRRRCRTPTTRCRPASTAWPGRSTVWPTRRC
jgi:citrate synthase